MAQCGNDKCPVVDKATCSRWWALSHTQESWLTRDQIMSLLLGQLASVLITGTVYIIQFYGFCCSMRIAQFEGGLDYRLTFFFSRAIPLLATGVLSTELTNNHVFIPTSQSAFNYLLLAIVYSALYLYKEGWWEFANCMKTMTKFYLPLALVDVEANFVVVKAYQYTTLTSVTLLDCFSIPCVVLGTWLLLKTSYNLRHGLGILLCVSGIGILVYSDFTSQKAPNVILGDFLTLLGATLYAISNVGAEKFVKEKNQFEYLAMIGIWGFLISGIQVSILEREAITAIVWNWQIILLVLGFGLVMFTFYSLVPLTLAMGGCTLWNLSLLTSDAFSVIASIFLFGQMPSSLFYVSLATVVVGILLFNLKNSPKAWTADSVEVVDDREEIGNDSENEVNNASDEEHQQFVEENPETIISV